MSKGKGNKFTEKTGIENAREPANSMQWKSFSCGGLERWNGHSHHTKVAVNRTIYFFGVDDGNGNCSEKSPIKIYILNTLESPLQWKHLSTETNNTFTPSVKHLGTVVASGHLIYLWDGSIFNSEVYVFNTEAFEWGKSEVKDVPVELGYHTATVVKNKLYVFGGLEFNTHWSYYSNSLKCLDFETLSWSSISPKNDPPTPRGFHSATVHGNRFILIFGGYENEKGLCNSLFYFDVETDEWIFPKVTGTVPEPRKIPFSFSHNGFMYIIGGYGNNGILNDLFRYEFVKQEWKKLTTKGSSPGPDPCELPNSLVIKDQVFILRRSNNPDITDNTFVLTIGTTNFSFFN